MSIFRGGGISPADFAPADGPPRGRRIPEGTAQQENLWAWLVDGSGHGLVEARAGTGKSSSCREGQWRLLEKRPGLRVRYGVFNKAAADEFKADNPPGVEVGTVHSFGYAALRGAFGSRVEKLKTFLILDETPAGRHLKRYFRKSVAMLVGAAKNQYARQPTWAELGELMDHYDINPYGNKPLIQQWAQDVLKRSAEWVEVCDFDDMIWLPALHATDFPGCDVLFLDEVQDWNPVQHALIPLLARGGRVVAVGDPYQAIYAWRGADPESMARLGVWMDDVGGRQALPLTLTFRCPKAHVRLAREYVPDIEAHGGNPEGEVEYEVPLDKALGSAGPGDLVLSPTNAPAISAALQLIARKRRATVRGRAVGDQLVSVVRSCGECRTVAELSRGVERWKSRELLRLEGMDGVEDVIDSVLDRAAGLAAILSGCDSPGDVEPAIASLFSEGGQAGAVTFSTIHRAKGSEAHHVFLLEVPTRAPQMAWQAQQARNLRYVALTRSKQSLTFVDMTPTR